MQGRAGQAERQENGQTVIHFYLEYCKGYVTLFFFIVAGVWWYGAGESGRQQRTTENVCCARPVAKHPLQSWTATLFRIMFTMLNENEANTTQNASVLRNPLRQREKPYARVL